MTAEISFSNNRISVVTNMEPRMDSQFKKLCAHWLLNEKYDVNEFKKILFSFLDKNYADYKMQDEFFSDFTPIWQSNLAQGRILKAGELWEWLLNLLYEWEKLNPGKRTHKGSLYYFWSLTCLYKKDFEKGFLLMHQALEEDIITTGLSLPQSPAYLFVTFKPKNPTIINAIPELKYINDSLDKYCTLRNKTLIFSQFESKFLTYPGSLKIVFLFAFTIFKTNYLLNIGNELKQNQFASLLEMNLLTDLCLIIENLIKDKKPALRDKTFVHTLSFLAAKAKLLLNLERLIELNSNFRSNFSETLNVLLSSQYIFNDGSKPQHIEEDLAISYGLRNTGSHRIENQIIIQTNFEELMQRILNSLFFVIETLY